MVRADKRFHEKLDKGLTDTVPTGPETVANDGYFVVEFQQRFQQLDFSEIRSHRNHDFNRQSGENYRLDDATPLKSGKLFRIYSLNEFKRTVSKNLLARRPVLVDAAFDTGSMSLSSADAKRKRKRDRWGGVDRVNGKQSGGSWEAFVVFSKNFMGHCSAFINAVFATKQ